MPRVSYYGFNYPYYNNNMSYNKKSFIFPNNYGNNSSFNEKYKENYTQKEKDNFDNDEHKKANKSNSNSSFKDEDFIFDLFGIKLYSDDILILSLLFFLYKEEVKDYSLFISLLLLLIS